MHVNDPPVRILQSSRSTITYLEKCRIHMDGERLVYARAQGGVSREWNIPCANTTVILLGSGASMTQGAARKLAQERVLVAFVGGGGLPIFMGSLSEYAPTEHLLRWIGFWPDEGARLAAARYFAVSRCDCVDELWRKAGVGVETLEVTSNFRHRAATAASVEQLRGFEGDFAKDMYKLAASATRVPWSGRQAGERDQDFVNSFLDQGNYLAYGAAGVTLWTLGVPPGLAVNHGATRAGGLVFDLADVVKDAVVLPCAFRAASSGSNASEFKDSVIESFDKFEIQARLFDFFGKAAEIGTKARTK